MKFLIFSLLVMPLLASHAVIVGEDNRISYGELSNFDPKLMAEATATQLSAKYLKQVDENNFTYPSGEIHNQCPGEKFSDMRTLGGCSGFLIAPDILVAAGHCNDYSISDCADDTWLFRHYTSPAKGRTLLKKDNLYHCKKVLDYKHDQMADYVVIQLDRPVKNATILKVDTRDQAELHDPLAILGYPLGLPFTYTPGGRVKSKNQMFIQADLDAFKNNSGSAVVNLRTGIVEGVLTNSQKGHSINALDGCVQSIHAPQDSRTVIVNRLSRIPYIQEHFPQQSRLKDYQVTSSCQGDVTVIAKYRSAFDHSWTTEVVENFKRNQKLQIKTKYQEIYLNVFDENHKSLVRGKDFYGFLDQSRFEEYGFRKMPLEQEVIELCAK